MKSRLDVVLAEYAALREELMYFLDARERNYQVMWALAIGQTGALLSLNTLPPKFLLLAYLFGTPILTLVVLYRTAANSASVLMVADYIHKGTRNQLDQMLGGLETDDPAVRLFDWEQHKARSSRLHRRLLMLLDVSQWAVFYASVLIAAAIAVLLQDHYDVMKSTGVLSERNVLFGLSWIVSVVCMANTTYFARKQNMIDSEANVSYSGRKGRERNEFRYAADTMDTARAIILTPEDDASTELRWDRETRAMCAILSPRAPADSRVLDFGMGIGRVAGALSSARPDLEIFGIDSSPHMRRLAKKYLAANSRIRIEADLASVPFESCDLAYAIFVLQHVSAEILPTVIKDIHRVLRPGGTLYILDSKRRCVPAKISAETAAEGAGPRAVDDVVRRIAIDELGNKSGEPAWADDGLSVVELLVREFGVGTIVELPETSFGRKTIERHHSMVFRKG